MVVVLWQVVRAIQDKVCEGRMQMWDVKGSRWRPVYTVVTDADVFVYDMQARTSHRRQPPVSCWHVHRRPA